MGNKTIRELEQEIEENSAVYEFYQRQPYTLVVVNYVNEKYESITGFGFSKVAHPDKWDAEVGYDIAYRRAIRDIRKQLEEGTG